MADHHQTHEQHAAHNGAHGDDDHIHLPPPSIAPFVISLGLMILLLGIVVHLIVLAIGLFIFVAGFALWIAEDVHVNAMEEEWT
jgi:hypothetical protein